MNDKSLWTAKTIWSKKEQGRRDYHFRSQGILLNDNNKRNMVLVQKQTCQPMEKHQTET